MKRALLFLCIVCAFHLTATTAQDVTVQFEQSARAMVSTLAERVDYSHMFITPYPYTLMMFHQANELRYTGMEQFIWDSDLNDWVSFSQLTIDYTDGYPIVFTQTINYQDYEYTMIYTFTHNNGLPTQLVVSSNLTGQLMETTRETYTYDVEYLIYVLAEINLITNWQNDYQMEFTWTGENITSMMETSWNGSEWENEGWETWEYNGSTPSLYTYRYWDGDQYVNEEQQTFTFSGELLTEELGKSWDGVDWINDYMGTFEWNGNNIENTLDMDWDGSQWVNDHRATYYMVDGALGYVTSEVWENEVWVNSGKYVYSYGVANDDENIPQISTDLNNYPNPFNPTTNISFTMASEGHVTLDIYNVRGQKVETLYNGYKNAGPHTLTWDANVAGGVYFAVMNTGNERIVRKMVLLK